MYLKFLSNRTSIVVTKGLSIPLNFKDIFRKYYQFVTDRIHESNSIASLLNTHLATKATLARGQSCWHTGLDTCFEYHFCWVAYLADHTRGRGFYSGQTDKGTSCPPDLNLELSVQKPVVFGTLYLVFFAIYFNPLQTWLPFIITPPSCLSFSPLSLSPSLHQPSPYFPPLADYDTKLSHKSNWIIDFLRGVLVCLAVRCGYSSEINKMSTKLKRGKFPCCAFKLVCAIWQATVVHVCWIRRPRDAVRSFAGYLHFCPQLIIPFLNHHCHPTTLLVATELLSGSTDP